MQKNSIPRKKHVCMCLFESLLVSISIFSFKFLFLAIRSPLGYNGWQHSISWTLRYATGYIGSCWVSFIEYKCLFFCLDEKVTEIEYVYYEWLEYSHINRWMTEFYNWDFLEFYISEDISWVRGFHWEWHFN